MMHEHSSLTSELIRFQDLRRRLVEADPQIDETTLLDTLEGATNLHEAICAIIRSALEDEAIAGGLRGRMDELEERLRRLEARSEKKREIVLVAMSEAGIEKIMAPDATISLRPVPQSVVVTDEVMIPDWFWVAQSPKLDRRRILESLKAGETVEGAELSNPRLCLSVRTR